MFLSNVPTNRGIIQIIIIIVIALLVLSYFGYSLRAIVNAPTTQDNFSYVGGAIVDVWNNYLKTPATYAWNFFIDLIWNPSIRNIQNMNNGQPSNVQQNAPVIPPANI